MGKKSGFPDPSRGGFTSTPRGAGPGPRRGPDLPGPRGPREGPPGPLPSPWEGVRGVVLHQPLAAGPRGPAGGTPLKGVGGGVPWVTRRRCGGGAARRVEVLVIAVEWGVSDSLLGGFGLPVEVAPILYLDRLRGRPPPEGLTRSAGRRRGDPSDPLRGPTPRRNRGAPAREVDVKPSREGPEKGPFWPFTGKTREKGLFSRFWPKMANFRDFRHFCS